MAVPFQRVEGEEIGRSRNAINRDVGLAHEGIV